VEPTGHKRLWIGMLAVTLLATLVVVAARFRLEAPAPVPPAAPTSQRGPAEQVSAWQPIFVGVDMCRASATRPRPMQIRAVRVDCREPTIDFLVTPSNGKEPQDCNARTTSQFLKEFKCQAAINGSVFFPAAKQAGDPVRVSGLSLSRGDLYSRPNQSDALLIAKDHTAWLAKAPIKVGKAYNGLSGFHTVLVDGKNTGDNKETHPRSAIGLSRDGRYLILMTIDGRQTGYSEGATTAETGEWLRRLGAHNGLNLDGGGSTTLVIEGPEGNPLLLNSPSGKYERWVANHLGVFARRLPASSGDKPRRPP
jgi:hypothetical protein